MLSKQFLEDRPLAAFLGLCLFFSGLGFTAVALLPGGFRPEEMPGLFFALLMVWGPTLAAGVIYFRLGRLKTELRRQLVLPPLSSWLLICSPTWVFGALLVYESFINGHSPDFSIISGPLLLQLVLFNLLLGPLGEELGWRGYLLPELLKRIAPWKAFLFTGIVWALWHGPLWFIESPQSKLSYLEFSGLLLVLSFLFGVIYRRSAGNLWAAILLHLQVNVVLNLAFLIKVLDNPNELLLKLSLGYLFLTCFFFRKDIGWLLAERE